MDAKNLIARLSKIRIIRFRFFNLKLWGNLRRGLYREFSTDDIITLIQEFHKLSTSTSIYATTQPCNNASTQSGSNYTILSRLCEVYYTYEGNDKLQKKIINEVEEIINELRNDNDAHAEFEDILNHQNENIMMRFRREHPSLKEKDYRLYSYLVARLSATTISVLLGKEKSVVYNRISRLKKQIKEDFLPFVN